MPTLIDVISAGLEAQAWIETAARGPWRRFGKFGRGAYYVMQQRMGECAAEELWWSRLDQTTPVFKVVGPTLDTIFDVGYKALNTRRPALDADAALEELGRA